jgi:GMP synthase-like glutamine amidotransferase
MRIHCLQHVPFEGPAGIADWAASRGHSVTTTPVYDGAPPPDPSGFDWLVVMGGPMGVYDEEVHPWLAAEKACLRETIAAGKTVIGVCLGAQLLAQVLGARVYRNPVKEIGWFPVELTEAARECDPFAFLPDQLTVYHWHGDTFDLPDGALHLARSEGCAHQAFLWGGRVLGLQFHLESTAVSVRDLVAHCADELVPGPYVQTAETMLAAAPEDYARLHAALTGILDRLPA